VFSIVLIVGIFYVKIRKLFLFAKEKNVMVSFLLLKKRFYDGKIF